jgi:hypothetical protein
MREMEGDTESREIEGEEETGGWTEGKYREGNR